jgi:hypothetical protein
MSEIALISTIEEHPGLSILQAEEFKSGLAVTPLHR